MVIQIGYCTNVHAGADLAQTQANLEKHACDVKKIFSPSQAMGLGLWLSASAARALIADNKVIELRDWLSEQGLVPFTLNGFPYGDFHREIVQHDVYLPTWNDERRLQYTLDLITILDQLLPEGMEGSISTLPLGWPVPTPTEDFLNGCAVNLKKVSKHLSELEQEQGRRITLCIEPEPGCILQRSTDLTSYFEEYLFGKSDEDQVRRYLGVCHDVCHAVVMFEEQSEVLGLYQAAGIHVGKVQISSAIVLPFDEKNADEWSQALSQLRQTHESRYLHQTMIQPTNSEAIFFENLPDALKHLESSTPKSAELRAHFHVPIYLNTFGYLHASQQAIRECIDTCRQWSDIQHYEVETYTWDVLPKELKVASLAEGIAEELRWFKEIL